MTMTGAELQCNREYLGLSIKWAADKLGTTVRQIHRWESGAYPVPEHIEQVVRAWLEVTQRAVGVAAVEVRNRPFLSLAVSRAETETDWPASWYRVVAARAAEITGGSIEWEKPQ
jgi:predicted transcriptional regulator